MTEQAQNDLQAIVDRLGPNMWLVLDEVAFPRYFGTGVAKRREKVKSAATIP